MGGVLQASVGVCGVLLALAAAVTAWADFRLRLRLRLRLQLHGPSQF